MPMFPAGTNTSGKNKYPPCGSCMSYMYLLPYTYYIELMTIVILFYLGPPGVQVISTTIEMETLNVFATPQCSSDDYKRLSLWLGGNGVIRHDRLIVSIPLPSSDTKRTQFINYFSPEVCEVNFSE